MSNLVVKQLPDGSISISINGTVAGRYRGIRELSEHLALAMDKLGVAVAERDQARSVACDIASQVPSNSAAWKMVQSCQSECDWLVIHNPKAKP